MTAASVEAMHHAKAAGAKVIVDADSFSSEMMDNIQNIDVFIGSEFFYNALFRDKTTRRTAGPCAGRDRPSWCSPWGPRGAWAAARRRGISRCPPSTCRWRTPWRRGRVPRGLCGGPARGLSRKRRRGLHGGVLYQMHPHRGRGGHPDWDTVQKYLQTGEIDYTEIDQRVEFYGRKLQL